MPVIQADTTMAIIRVTAPDDVEPDVLGAGVTRALHRVHHHPIAAELVHIPAWHPREKRGHRRHCFAAVLTSLGHDSPDELADRARRHVLPSLREEFGERCKVKIKPVGSEDQVDGFWMCVRGNPHRQSA